MLYILSMDKRINKTIKINRHEKKNNNITQTRTKY